MKPRRQPRFLWRAGLILLPVVGLAVVGLVSLRQDRALVEQDAREQAGRIATEAADRARRLLFAPEPTVAPDDVPLSAGLTDFPSFEINSSLDLMSPKALNPIPAPQPRDPAELAPGAAADWEEGLKAVLAGEMPDATNAWTRFLASAPPPSWAADAAFLRAAGVARMGDASGAAAMFTELAGQHPEAVGESGLPLAPLARWRAATIELSQATDVAQRVTLVHSLGSNLVMHPTALTTLLLERLAASEAGSADGDTRAEREAVEKWRGRWKAHEQARALFAAARTAWRGQGLPKDGAEPPWVPPVWVELVGDAAVGASAPEGPREAWLVTGSPTSAHGLRCRARSQEEVGRRLANVIREQPGLPPFFAVAFTIAGRTLPPAGPWRLLAARTAEDAAVLASVYLTDPAALYARQRQRAWWFGGLIVAAVVTALGGLLAAQRAFQRQLRLNEMKSNFVSSVSHELRAPIASVRLLAESLDRGRVADESRRREYYRLIGQECRRLSSLIENVLDFSRIDQGRKRYEFEPTDLVALVTQTMKLLEPYAAEREVTLRFLPPARFDVQPSLDGRALQQALVNLIDNAVKHSPAGASVEVALDEAGQPIRAEAPAGNRGGSSGIRNPKSGIWDQASSIRLTVTDHGPGIPATERSRIFEPFHRLGSELRRETTGVGIGLSIVKHIVEAHGGRVWVEGEVGQGSRFVIELPAKEVPET